MTGCNGLIVALWHCRLWFVYAVLITSVFKIANWLAKHVLNGSPLLALDQSSTWESYIFSVGMTLVTYWMFASKLSRNEWALAKSQGLSLTPFESVTVADTAMFTQLNKY